MFTFDDFRAKVKQDGLARSNRFYISIAPPNLKGESARLFGGASQELRDLHLLCKSVNIPGVSLLTAQLRLTGEQIEIPTDRAFAPATFTFYVDRKMIVRKFFDDWMFTVQDFNTRAMGWYQDFIAPSIVVYTCDRQSRAVYAIVLYNAKIKSIGNLQLDQQTNDVMTFDATIDYHYYLTILIDQPDIDGASSSRSARLERNGAMSPTAGVTAASVDPTQFIQSLSQVSEDALNNSMNTFMDSLGLGSFTENFTEFQEVFDQGLGELTSAGQSLVGSINQSYGQGMQQFNGIKNTAMSAIGGFQSSANQLSSLTSGFGGGGGWI